MELSVGKTAKSAVRDRGALNHLLPAFGKLALEDVTPKLLGPYKTQRRLEQATPATINKELQLIRHAYNLAMREWEWCRENPMRRVSMEKVRNEVDRWLTPHEEERLTASSSVWLREIIMFAVHTGMRQGEILNLQWQDVDFVRSTFVVMKSNNGMRRTLPINSVVYELLAAKQAKKGFRFHNLRHTFATRLVQRGVDLYKVQRLIGHKTQHMTQRYAHHSPESKRAK